MARLGRTDGNGNHSSSDRAIPNRFSGLAELANNQSINPPEIIKEPSELNSMPATKPSPPAAPTKVAKSKSSSHTRATLHLTRSVDKGLNRMVEELDEEGIKCDRSDVINEVFESILLLSKTVGASQALEKVKRLNA